MYAEPEVAVQSYIDALLHDPLLCDARLHEPELPAKPASPAESLSVNEAHSPAELADKSAGVSGQEASTTLDRQQAFVQHLALAQQKGNGAAHSPYPEWAEDEFSCLLVNVANLKLAIPACFIDATIACVPGQSSSDPDSILMSCDANTGQPVMTADTAKIVMPERYESRMRSAYRHKVMLKDCDVALAVDSIVGEVSYQPKQVRWRGAYTRRFWLAGTVIQDMCALLDVAAIHREVLANQVLGDEVS